MVCLSIGGVEKTTLGQKYLSTRHGTASCWVGYMANVDLPKITKINVQAVYQLPAAIPDDF